MRNNEIQTIELQNFKNFDYVNTDFTAYGKSDYKMLTFIYGLNAVGKSNLFSVFNFLKEISSVFINKYSDSLDYLLKNSNLINDSDFEELQNYLSRVKALSSNRCKDIIDKYKRYGSKGQKMVVRISFYYNDIYYEYSIETDDNMFLRETLNYRDNVRIVRVFDVRKSEVFLNNNLFSSKTFEKLLNYEIKSKYGSYSFLAILNSEYRNNNYDFLINTIAKPVLSFLDSLSNFVVVSNENIGSNNNAFYGKFKYFLPNLLEGDFSNGESFEVAKINSINFLLKYFNKYMPEVIDLYYETTLNKGQVHYKLLFKRKLIDGSVIVIPYNEESYGNRAFATLINCFFHVLIGEIVIIDDIYFGLHASIIKDIFKDFSKDDNSFYINSEKNNPGQLIYITQNVLLMDFDLRSNIFILKNKNNIYNFSSISSYSRTIQKSTNIINAYLNNPNSEIYLNYKVNKED